MSKCKVLKFPVPAIVPDEPEQGRVNLSLDEMATAYLEGEITLEELYPGMNLDSIGAVKFHNESKMIH